MSTQNGNNNFQWRPNDNSVTTNLRYDLEMNHWLKSLNTSSVKSTFQFSSSFVVIGMIISLFLNLIFFILICLSDVIVWIVNKTKKNHIKRSKEKIKPMLSKDRLDEMWETRTIIEDDTS